MKCLEFLYFYLLDETSSISSLDAPQVPPGFTGPPMSNDSPAQPSGRVRPSHRSTVSLSTTASRDSSGSSYSSIFSANSAASTSATSISSAQSTPRSSGEYQSSSSDPSTPNAQKLGPAFPIPGLAPSPRIVTPPNQHAQPRSLLMLRKDVDYVPLSPKKAQISRLGIGGARAPSGLRAKPTLRGAMDVLSSEDTEGEETPQTPRPSRSSHTRGQSTSSQSDVSSVLSSPEAPVNKTPLTSNRDRHRRAQSSADVMSGLSTSFQPSQPSRASSDSACLPSAGGSKKAGARTMEEKREILGTMLGNVDALVEGMRKAGIWGLG